MISTVLWLLNDMLSLKTYVNVPTLGNKRKRKKKTHFLLASRKPLPKSAGSGVGSEPVIQCTDQRSGSILKYQGSGTLVTTAVQ